MIHSIDTLPLRQRIFCIVSLALLLAGAVVAIPLQHKLVGYGLLGLGALSLIGTDRSFRRHIGLIFISISIIAATPIDTSISLGHMAAMGLLLAAAVLVPYVIVRFVYKDKTIRFPVSRHTWTKGHLAYLGLALVLSYLLLPFWMSATGQYHNWTVEADPLHLILLFIGTNSLGIWDELFFIITVLALLRTQLVFWQANLVQAVLFTSFLYELGFRSWAPLLIFPFALLQGIVFRKTENLVYVIAIHLTLDLVLYLALINAHHPDLLPIFITKL